MSHRSHSAEAESNVGSMMESEYELNDDQWGLIFRPAWIEIRACQTDSCSKKG